MDEFKIIVVMNEAMLKLLKDKNANYEENLKIKKYLEDEAIFFKINKLNAYKIFLYIRHSLKIPPLLILFIIFKILNFFF